MFDKSASLKAFSSTGVTMAKEVREQSEKVEEFKERARSRYHHTRPQTRMGVPWYILVVNILLIAYIMFMYGRQATQEEDEGAMLRFRNIEYSLAFVKERDSGERMITFAARALTKGPADGRYGGSVATAEFRHGNHTIAAVALGAGTKSLALQGGEIRTFVESFPLQPLRKYASENPGALKPKKKSIVSLEARHLPLSLILTIHTDDPVSTSVAYKFNEVD